MKCSISHFMKTSKFSQNDQNVSIGALYCKYVISVYECAISSLKRDRAFEKLNLSEHQLHWDKGVHFMWTNAHTGTWLCISVAEYLPKEISTKIPFSQLLVTVLTQLHSHLQIPVSNTTTSDIRIKPSRMVQSCTNHHFKYWDSVCPGCGFAGWVFLFRQR